MRAALHSPQLADLWQALGAFLRYSTQLTPRLSELAILVTGRACGSPFEWYAHAIEARQDELESSLRRVLGLLIDWVESDTPLRSDRSRHNAA